jgi:hypothetical protein
LGVTKPRVLNNIAKNLLLKRKVWRQQMGQSESVNRRTENTMAKRKKDKERYTKHTHTTKDRVIWTPLKTKGIWPLF